MTERKRSTNLALIGLGLTGWSLVASVVYYFVVDDSRLDAIRGHVMFEDPYTMVSGVELIPEQEEYVLSGQDRRHPPTKEELDKYFVRNKVGHLVTK